MSDTNKRLPYETLGAQLRKLRERSRESVAEVCGAVEIDEKDLGLIESGTERPSEDILLLLISHFSLGDDQAAELWQLAGYDQQCDNPEHDHEQDHNHDDRERSRDQQERSQQSSRQQTLMVMIDPRVMYSDSIEVVANDRGVVLNFSQVGGQHGQPLTVARIGMSREQAKMVMGILHQTLYDLENPRRKTLGDGK
jgi:transcriptional regulator with XRE-family HTH domain